MTIDDLEHGSVTASVSNATSGQQVLLSVTPDEDYALSSLWYSYGQNDENTVQIENYTFSMPSENITIHANFEKLSYSLTKAPTLHGSFSVAPETSYRGTEVSVTPTCENGYEVQRVYYIVEDSTTEVAILKDEHGVYKFQMPGANATVYVAFKLIDFTITKQSQNGTIIAPDSANKN